MEFDGCEYEPELVERVRELAVDGEVKEVTPQIPLGRETKPTNTGEYSNQQQQAPLGSGLLGAAPQGFPQATGSMLGAVGSGLLGAAPQEFPQASGSMLGGATNLMQQAVRSKLENPNCGNEQSSEYTSDGRHDRKHCAPNDENDNPDKAMLKELAHRIEWVCKKPQCLLDQPFAIISNAAGYKRLEVEYIEVKKGKKRKNWIVNIYLENMKLITYNSPKGMHYKVARNNAADECINNLMNPTSFTINRQKKTSPKGKEFDKEVVVVPLVPLPCLTDVTYQNYKQKCGPKIPNFDGTGSFDPNDRFANFILVETDRSVPEDFRDMNTLQNSARVNKRSKLEMIVSDTKISLNGEKVWQCKCILNGVLIGIGTHENQKMVKHSAAKVAVEYLRKRCPLVQPKHDYEVDQKAAICKTQIVHDCKVDQKAAICKTQIVHDCNVDQKAAICETRIVKGGDRASGLPSSSDAIGEENIGHKMLKMMGWTGEGGLGKGGSGITEPIIAIKHTGREGIGFSKKGAVPKKKSLDTDAVTKKKRRKKGHNTDAVKKKSCLDEDAVTKIIKDYIASGSRDPLVFPSSLESHERKQIHDIAKKFKLKSKSYGEDEERYLTVSIKRSVQQVVMDAVQVGSAGSGYEVSLPGAGVPTPPEQNPCQGY